MNQNKLFAKLMKYFTLDCISFTIACLLLSILSAFRIVENLDYHALLQLFFCTTVFSLVMFLTSLVLKDSQWKELIIGLINGILVILMIGGGLFRWFPWAGSYVILVISVFLITYLLSYGLVLAENVTTSKKINHILQEKKAEKK